LQFLAKAAAIWAYEQASAFMEIFARFPNPYPALSVPSNGGASHAPLVVLAFSESPVRCVIGL